MMSTKYEDICSKTTPFDGDMNEYAIRVFFKYLAKTESGVADGQDVYDFLLKLGLRPDDNRYQGLFSALYQPGTDQFKTGVTAEDFLQFLETCSSEDKDFIRRVFAREENLVDLSESKHCVILWSITCAKKPDHIQNERGVVAIPLQWWQWARVAIINMKVD